MTERIKEDDPVEAVMEYLRTLDPDAQAAAAIDLESALNGGPNTDRPLWLRNASHGTIVEIRQRMTGAIPLRATGTES